VLEKPIQERRDKTADLEEKIEQRQLELSQARQAGKELAIWEARSLPTDIEMARSLYQAWLLELVDHVGLTDRVVDSAESLVRKSLWRPLSFTVRAHGTLEQLTAFLFEFYSAGHLHGIKSLSITPMGKEEILELSIGIEALVLPGTDRTDRLSFERSDVLASENLADYRVIVQRDLFAVGGGYDATEQAYLTAVTDVDGHPKAWFNFRLRGETLKLSVGETLEVGLLKGVIVEIVDSDVILETDGERWLLSVGENLAQAYALPPEY